MAITVKGASTANQLEITSAGEANTLSSVKGVTYTPTTATIAASATTAANGVTGNTGGAPVMYILVKNSSPGNQQLIFEGTDGSGTWVALMATRHDSGITAPFHNLGNMVTGGLAGYLFSAPVVGLTQVRCRFDINSSAQVTTFVFQPSSLAYAPPALTVPPRILVTLANVGAVAAATATETLFSLTRTKLSVISGLSQTTGTSYQVSYGRTLRIQSMTFTQTGNATATAAQTFFRFRGEMQVASSSGLSASVFAAAQISTPATALAYDSVTLAFGDGLDLWGGGFTSLGTFVGVSYYSQYTTNAPTLGVQIVGYEY